MFSSFIIAHPEELLAVAWIMVAARQILFWLHFIQLKQYRLDRLWLAIKQPSFFKLLASTFRVGVYALFIIWTAALRAFTLKASVFGALYAVIIVFYLVWVVQQFILLYRGTIQLPKMTPKILALFALLLGGETYLLLLFKFWPEQVLAIDILQPLIVFTVFALLLIPNAVRRQWMIRAAAKKRQRFPHLKVIGITGSYGKTTMKEYLAHLLSRKYRVLKTPMHMNVDTGIAKLVLSELTSEHEVLVVEMGAYREREIASICRIVQPQYGVMTALGNQHLELFGSQEAIEKAKFELVDAVKNPAHVFANADSQLLREAFAKRHMQPIWYALQSAQAKPKPEYVTYKDGQTTFTLGGTTYQTNIFATGALTNLVGAIAVAQALEVSPAEIQSLVQELPAIDQTMELIKGVNGATFIDSSYNASTEAVIAAIRDLSVFQGFKKIMVFKEVIELGKDSDRDHRLIASHMAEVLDKVVLLPSAQRETMVKTLLDHGFDANRIYRADQAHELSRELNDRTVVLLMGRGSEAVLPRSQS